MLLYLLDMNCSQDRSYLQTVSLKNKYTNELVSIIFVHSI